MKQTMPELKGRADGKLLKRWLIKYYNEAYKSLFWIIVMPSRLFIFIMFEVQ